MTSRDAGARDRAAVTREVLPRDATGHREVTPRARKTRFRLVRLLDGAVLSGGPTRASCERQLAVINAYGAIAEIVDPKKVTA